MFRWLLHISYDGSAFSGWQRQPGITATIQGYLENALQKIAKHPIQCVAAGRTDAGVHANCQLVHFDTSVVRPSVAWVRGVNSYLPQMIRVIRSFPVPLTFHARFSAIKRCYTYSWYCLPYESPLLVNRSLWVRQEINYHKLQHIAGLFEGEHDFSSFRGSKCQASSPRRNMYFVRVNKKGPYIFLTFCANAFLYHMIRYIVGALLWVMLNRRDEKWLRTLIENPGENVRTASVPGYGLYFEGACYPDYDFFSDNYIPEDRSWMAL